MKNNIIQIVFALFFITGAILSCQKNDDFSSPDHEEVMVNFDSSYVEVLENDEEQIIRLSFDRKSTKSGVLTFSVSDADPSRFTTVPAISNGQMNINVTQNQESVSIQIKPVNNSLPDGNLEFTVSASGTTAGFTFGERNSALVKLQDDEFIAAEEVEANFIQTDKNVPENSISGKTYSIGLSEKLTSPGSIEISLESTKAVYGLHFNTIPNANNGKIILTPSIGESHDSFTILAVDNSFVSGELEITFTITGTTGPITLGSELSHAITIVDDELTNRPKGYESNGGGWRLKKVYEYDSIGRIRQVNTEKSTPTTSHHAETYYYGSDGRIQQINTYPNIDIVFTWSNNTIVKSETVDNGTVKEYIEYDYDSQGNVSGTANYFRQPDGQFKLGFLNIYFYFQDGNLSKSQTFIPTEGPEDLILISTRSYDQYIDAVNPFPIVDILPTVKTHTKLPSIYMIEENGVILHYNFTYEFREDGLVSKRMARTANLSETTHYLYY